MNKPKIILTRRWPDAAEAKLMELFDVSLNENDKPFSEGQLQDALRHYDAVLPTVTDAFTAEVLNAEPLRAKILANFGVGYNHIDLDAAQARGITVTNTPDVLTDCTADIAFGLLLAVARRIGEGERIVRAGRWKGWRPNQMLGTKVTGKTLGIIGFGRIGQAMAKRAHFGFDMSVIYYTPHPPCPANVADLFRPHPNPNAVELAPSPHGGRPGWGRSISSEASDLTRPHPNPPPGGEGIIEHHSTALPSPAQWASPRESIEAVLREADFVSLHCPGSKANRHLINAERLALMKPSAFLINTARGDVVDSVALISALKNQTIAGAGLDVYEGEPNINPGFLELENAVLVPHFGSATTETRVAMGFRVIDNLVAFFNGEEPSDKII